MEEQPPAMEVSCEYIDSAVVDRQQGVALQLGGWAWGKNPVTNNLLTHKITLFISVAHKVTLKK
jgi:hypothetical protein